MLLALLNCCTKEELEESSDEEAIISPTTPSEESQERRKVIKNKILAVGRMSRVFALLRWVSFTVIASPFADPFNTVRSRRRYQNSRVSLALLACHMVPLRWAQKVSRMLSPALRMRAYYLRLNSSHLAHVVLQP